MQRAGQRERAACVVSGFISPAHDGSLAGWTVLQIRLKDAREKQDESVEAHILSAINTMCPAADFVRPGIKTPVPILLPTPMNVIFNLYTVGDRLSSRELANAAQLSIETQGTRSAISGNVPRLTCIIHSMIIVPIPRGKPRFLLLFMI